MATHLSHSHKPAAGCTLRHRHRVAFLSPPFPPHPPPSSVYLQHQSDPRSCRGVFCDCYACPDGGRSDPPQVSRSTFYLQKQPEKRRHIEYGGGGGGPANDHPQNGGGGPSGGQARPASDSRERAGARASGPARDGCRCDAEETPESSVASSDSDEGDEADIANNVPPPEFLVEPEAQDEIASPPSPIYQPAVSTNELRLPVGEFKDHRADLALYAFAVQHNLTQAAVADLLRLGTSAAKYRTPYLLEQFIKASVNLETRKVDCCRNGCLAYTHKRALQTECDACGAPRHETVGRPAKQITYFSTTSWLAHLLGDPIIG